MKTGQPIAAIIAAGICGGVANHVGKWAEAGVSVWVAGGLTAAVIACVLLPGAFTNGK